VVQDTDWAQRQSSAQFGEYGKGSGQPLPGGVQGRLESALGTDLAGVRVHTGERSAQAAEGLGANAYTVGQDIHFAPGQYAPGSQQGDRLIAHEVAHTVQQRGAGPAVQADSRASEPGDSHEVQAESFAQAFAAGAATPAVTKGAAPAGVIHRDRSDKKPREEDDWDPRGPWHGKKPPEPPPQQEEKRLYVSSLMSEPRKGKVHLGEIYM